MDCMCRHCGKARKALFRWGLCCGCYRNADVRGAYRPDPKREYEGILGPAWKPASVPTMARPGSLGKVVALMERAAAGEELWHQADAR